MAKGKKRKRLALTAGAAAGLLLLLVVGFNLWTRCTAPASGPLIGISSDTAWHSRLGLTTATYETALARLNVRIWEFRPGDAQVDEILDRIDGLILAGGYDVDPALYGGSPQAANTIDPERDSFEVELIKKALDRDLPILGICRGLQILNVVHEGSLRNIRADPKLGPAHGGELSQSHRHQVTVAPGSKWAAIVGPGPLEVNSYHGQAIAKLGKKLFAAARTGDGVIEAAERRDRRFVLATQWHPEILSLKDETHLAIFRELVKAAAEHSAGRQRSSPAAEGR